MEKPTELLGFLSRSAEQLIHPQLTPYEAGLLTRYIDHLEERANGQPDLDELLADEGYRPCWFCGGLFQFPDKPGQPCCPSCHRLDVLDEALGKIRDFVEIRATYSHYGAAHRLAKGYVISEYEQLRDLLPQRKCKTTPEQTPVE